MKCCILTQLSCVRPISGFAKLQALKRWGKPEEIGYAAVFLASNKAAFVTGQKISVSGGFGV
jgi:NAD(P)-dependent dehydrogenase (short-subunit alcohol dehydrogenase family)